MFNNCLSGPSGGGNGKMTSVTEIMSFAKKRKLNDDPEIFNLPVSITLKLIVECIQK